MHDANVNVVRCNAPQRVRRTRWMQRTEASETHTGVDELCGREVAVHLGSDAPFGQRRIVRSTTTSPPRAPDNPCEQLFQLCRRVGTPSTPHWKPVREQCRPATNRAPRLRLVSLEQPIGVPVFLVTGKMCPEQSMPIQSTLWHGTISAHWPLPGESKNVASDLRIDRQSRDSVQC